MGFRRQYFRPRVLNMGPQHGYRKVTPYKPSVQETVWRTMLSVFGFIFGRRKGPKGAAGTIRGGQKPVRNKPCPCGSGMKFKRCCGATRQQQEFRMKQWIRDQERRRKQHGNDDPTTRADDSDSPAAAGPTGD